MAVYGPAATRLLNARKERESRSLGGVQDEGSFLKSLGGGLLSGLASAGNLLDLPGSMVRDTLGGENPFDQVLTPFSHENRLSGRGLLTKWGLTNKNDPNKWEAEDFAGFGAEVLFDPLTYLTLGGSALTKSGKIAKAAGLMDYVPGAYVNKLKSLPDYKGQGLTGAGGTGKRASLMGTNLNDLADFVPTINGRKTRDVLDELARKEGTTVDALSKEGLGGLVGIGVPFKEPAMAFGKSNIIGSAFDIPGKRASAAMKTIRGTNRDRVQKGMAKIWSKDEADIAMQIWDARANTWATATGQDPDAMFGRVLDIKKSELFNLTKDALFQDALDADPARKAEWFIQSSRTMEEIIQNFPDHEGWSSLKEFRDFRDKLSKGGKKDPTKLAMHVGKKHHEITAGLMSDEELRYLGIDTLFSETDGKVTPQMIYDKAAENYLELEEVVRGADSMADEPLGLSMNEGYNAIGGENPREFILKLPGSQYSNSAMDAHFGHHKGVVAHLRTQDFTETLPDGKQNKWLLGDESQSDWAAKGTDKESGGWAKEVDVTPEKARELEDELVGVNRNIEDAKKLLKDELSFNDEQRAVVRSDIESYEARAEELRAALDSGRITEGVPRMPFEKSWKHLIAKKLLKVAAEGGYDKIAISSASEQAARWRQIFPADGLRSEIDRYDWVFRADTDAAMDIFAKHDDENAEGLLREFMTRLSTHREQQWSPATKSVYEYLTDVAGMSKETPYLADSLSRLNSANTPLEIIAEAEAIGRDFGLTPSQASQVSIKAKSNINFWKASPAGSANRPKQELDKAIANWAKERGMDSEAIEGLQDAAEGILEVRGYRGAKDRPVGAYEAESPADFLGQYRKTVETELAADTEKISALRAEMDDLGTQADEIYTQVPDLIDRVDELQNDMAYYRNRDQLDRPDAIRAAEELERLKGSAAYRKIGELEAAKNELQLQIWDEEKRQRPRLNKKGQKIKSYKGGYYQYDKSSPARVDRDFSKLTNKSSLDEMVGQRLANAIMSKQGQAGRVEAKNLHVGARFFETIYDIDTPKFIEKFARQRGWEVTQMSDAYLPKAASNAEHIRSKLTVSVDESSPNGGAYIKGADGRHIENPAAVDARKVAIEAQRREMEEQFLSGQPYARESRLDRGLMANRRRQQTMAAKEAAVQLKALLESGAHPSQVHAQEKLVFKLHSDIDRIDADMDLIDEYEAVFGPGSALKGPGKGYDELTEELYGIKGPDGNPLRQLPDGRPNGLYAQLQVAEENLENLKRRSPNYRQGDIEHGLNTDQAIQQAADAVQRLDDEVYELNAKIDFVKRFGDPPTGPGTPRRLPSPYRFPNRQAAEQFADDFAKNTAYKNAEQVKTLPLTQAMRDDILKKGMPLFQPGGRAAVEFTSEGAIIHALGGHDLSSLMHETAHIFLEDMWAHDRPLAQMAQKALGLGPNEKWTVEAHEKFASAFERYLRDGQAPIAGLKAVFQRLKQWFTNIYEKVMGTPLANSVSPEMKAVFDKMLGGTPNSMTPLEAGSMARGMTQTFAQKAAGILDNVGITARWSAPGRAVNQVMNAAVKGRDTKLGQLTAESLTRANEATRAQVRRIFAENVQKLVDNNLIREADGDLLRQIGEGVADPDTTEAANKVLFEVAEAMTGEFKDLFDAFKNYGIPIDQLEDQWAKYWPRFQTEFVGKGAPKPDAPFVVSDDSQIGRILQFRDIQGGTVRIKNIVRGIERSTLRKTKPAQLVMMIKQRWGRDTFRSNKHGLEFVRLLKKQPDTVLDTGFFGNHPLVDALQRLQSGWMAVDSADAVMEAIATHGLADMGTASLAANRVVDMNSQIMDSLGTGIPQEFLGRIRGMSTKDFGGTRTTTLGDLLNKAQLVSRNEATGVFDDAKPALTKIAEKMGVPIDPNDPLSREILKEMQNWPIPQREANDLLALVEGFKSPNGVGPIMQKIDSWTNLFKAGVTGVWPAFHMRNLISGQFQNKLTGQFSFASLKESTDILFGRESKGLKSIPEVARRLKAEGRAVNDKEAADMIRRLAFEHEIVHKYEGLGADVTGQAQTAAGRNLNDEFAGGLNAKQPMSIVDIARQAVFKDKVGAPKLKGKAKRANLKAKITPWNVRGVGGRIETKFGPAAAGLDTGYIIEGMNRLAPFIHNLRKGIDPQAAADMVKAAQVDYATRKYTNFERQALMRLFPFYKFSSRIAANTAQQLMTAPGGPLAQTIRASGLAQRDKQAVPDYIGQTMAVDLGTLEDGSQRYFTGIGAMHEDPFSFLGGGVRGAGIEALSRMNPLVKGPAEWFTGQSFFQRGPLGGRPIEDLDPTVGRTISNIKQHITGEVQRDPVDTPRGLEFILANSPLARAATSMRVATDPRKGFGARMLNLGSGFRVSDISPSAQDAVVKEEVQRLMKEADAGDFRRVYFRKEDLERMNPAQRQWALQLQAAMDILASRAKVRKKEKKKAG